MMLYEQLGSSRIFLRHIRYMYLYIYIYILWKDFLENGGTRNRPKLDYFRNQWFWSIAILGNLHKYHGHVYVYCLYPIGSMVLVYMLTKMGYIDGIYVSIYTSTMDPRGMYAWNSKLAWNPKVSVWKMIFSHWTWQINEGRLVGQGHTWKPNDQITFLWGAGPQISGVKTWFLQIIWDQVAILCQNCRESLFQHAIWYINIYLYIYIYIYYCIASTH